MKKGFVLFVAIIWLTIISPVAQAQNRTLQVSPKPGIWKVIGKDEENTFWKATLRFTKQRNFKSLVKYKGYFSWHSSDNETSGIEYFTASFQKTSGKLVLKGYRIKNFRGNLCGRVVVEIDHLH